MTAYDMEELRRIAAAFRRGLEAISQDQRHICFRDFPRGACGNSSLLLGAYLADLGMPGFVYMCGERGEVANNTDESHAWLQREDCIVDITADQFDGITVPVFVGRVGDSALHASFELEPPGSADFRDYHSAIGEELAWMYAFIGEYLAGAEQNPRLQPESPAAGSPPVAGPASDT